MKMLIVLAVLCLIAGCHKQTLVRNQRDFSIVGNRLVKSTFFEGKVLLKNSLYIPKGKTLLIRSGSKIVFSGRESRRLMPPFIGKRTQIMVAGRLLVEGEKDNIVTLSCAENNKKWQGIVILPGGEAIIKHAKLKDVVSGVTSLRGKYSIENTEVSGFEYGLYSYHSVGKCENLTLKNGNFGVYSDNNNILPVSFRVKHPVRHYSLASIKNAKTPNIEKPPPHWRIQYRGKTDINRDQVWNGDILIRRRIRVARGATLKIMPGSRVFFEYIDYDGDGLGDAEIMVVGRIIAIGSTDKEIEFLPLDNSKRWAGIRIIDSDTKSNVFEHVKIKNAIRGIHGHFAAVSIKDSRFENNISNLEFQDSKFYVDRCLFTNSLTGIRFRNAYLSFTNNKIVNSLNGIECSKSEIKISSCIFENNSNFALKTRQSKFTIYKNIFTNNRKGTLFYKSKGELKENKFIEQAESGVYSRDSKISLIGNLIQGNNFDGLVIKKTKTSLVSNKFFFNQHNGISVNGGYIEKSGNSFQGNVKTDIFYQKKENLPFFQKR